MIKKTLHSPEMLGEPPFTRVCPAIFVLCSTTKPRQKQIYTHFHSLQRGFVLIGNLLSIHSTSPPDSYSKNRTTILLPGLELEPPKDCQKVVYFSMSRFFPIFSNLSGPLTSALVGGSSCGFHCGIQEN